MSTDVFDGAREASLAPSNTSVLIGTPSFSLSATFNKFSSSRFSIDDL